MHIIISKEGLRGIPENPDFFAGRFQLEDLIFQIFVFIRLEIGLFKKRNLLFQFRKTFFPVIAFFDKSGILTVIPDKTVIIAIEEKDFENAVRAIYREFNK